MTTNHPTSFSHITTLVVTHAPAQDAWEAITDWPGQTRWIPFTVVAIDADSPAQSGVGTRFTARTKLGPLVIDDAMEVVGWTPPGATTPGVCDITKHGRWILGSARLEVDPGRHPADLTTIRWIEDIRVRGVPAIFNPLGSVVGTILFGGVLKKARRDLDRNYLP